MRAPAACTALQQGHGAPHASLQAAKVLEELREGAPKADQRELWWGGSKGWVGRGGRKEGKRPFHMREVTLRAIGWLCNVSGGFQLYWLLWLGHATSGLGGRKRSRVQQCLGGLGITSWTSSSAARLSLIHQMLFLLLSSPVGLNFPPPGALWLGQGLERPGGGGRVSFKITQGVDSSLAVVFWKGLTCPNRSVLCPRPSAVGTCAVAEPAVGALVVDEPWRLGKDQRSPVVHS